MIPSILTFDFDLILGLFLVFGALMGYFWDRGKNFCLIQSHDFSEQEIFKKGNCEVIIIVNKLGKQ